MHFSMSFNSGNTSNALSNLGLSTTLGSKATRAALPVYLPLQLSSGASGRDAGRKLDEKVCGCVLLLGCGLFEQRHCKTVISELVLVEQIGEHLSMSVRWSGSHHSPQDRAFGGALNGALDGCKIALGRSIDGVSVRCHDSFIM
jgi:hypothetical protein